MDDDNDDVKLCSFDDVVKKLKDVWYVHNFLKNHCSNGHLVEEEMSSLFNHFEHMIIEMSI